MIISATTKIGIKKETQFSPSNKEWAYAKSGPLIVVNEKPGHTKQHENADDIEDHFISHARVIEGSGTNAPRRLHADILCKSTSLPRRA